ncbi:uncharacterized protein LOC135825396 [Sycon ciliatum]|uniref:uncharacterized protein LOC135825396 n=1 Tax=Sycon ciliatum TaxID=27933 RepID=UPI0031F6E5B9
MSTYPLFDLEEGDDAKRLAPWQKQAVASVWKAMKEDATPQDIIDYLIQYLVMKPAEIHARHRLAQEVTEDILKNILKKPVKCLKVFGKALCHEDYCSLHLAELFHKALELQKQRAESSTMSPGNTSNGSSLSDTAAMEAPPFQDHSVHFGQQCEQEEETALPFPQQHSMVNDDESYDYSGNGRQPLAVHNRAAAAAAAGAVSSTAGVGFDFPDGAAASAAAVSRLPAGEC